MDGPPWPPAVTKVLAKEKDDALLKSNYEYDCVTLPDFREAHSFQTKQSAASLYKGLIIPVRKGGGQDAHSHEPPCTDVAQKLLPKLVLPRPWHCKAPVSVLLCAPGKPQRLCCLCIALLHGGCATRIGPILHNKQLSTYLAENIRRASRMQAVDIFPRDAHCAVPSPGWKWWGTLSTSAAPEWLCH